MILDEMLLSYFKYPVTNWETQNDLEVLVGQAVLEFNIDQNNMHILINNHDNSRTVWPTEILMWFLSFSAQPTTLRHRTKPEPNRPVARARSQDRFFFGGGCGTPKKWTFWTQKVDFFEPHPPLPSYKPIFGPLCG